MAIDYPAILELKDQGRRFSWSDRETILYALAIGMGADPLDRELLPFVYERNLKAMPTLATVIAWGASIPADRLGTDRRHTLHGEESLTLHSPLPAAGEVVADSRVRAVYDKGEKGAVIERETILRDAVSGVLIATIIRTAFARKDGGFGGPVQQSAPHAPPARSPDVVLEFATRPDQALLYRLCGDRNPLHADPDVATAAGFRAPILHGLCTYGICCRAVLQAFCEFDPARLKSHAVRFSAPVFPGDTVAVKLWKDAGVVSFEADVAARAVTVIKSGRSEVS
jgi:acyl dehydratase